MPKPEPYFEEDGCTIYLGDCREILPHLSKVDLVLTDPPYGVAYAGSATKWSLPSGNGYSAFEDTPENVRDICVPAFVAALGIAKRGCLTPGIPNARLYPQPDAEGVIWYPSGANSGPWGFVTHQPIYYYGSCPYLSTGRGRRPTGFQSTEPAEQNGHPCPKPLGQMLWLVKRASLPWESILDPFMGSGTTLVAAKQLGRRAIGCEIERRYCDIAIERLRQKVLPLAVEPQPEPVPLEGMQYE